MKNGTCPKCGGVQVYHCRIPKNGGGVSQAEDCRYLFLQDIYTVQMTLEWESYLCTDCGYFENYCLDQALMEKITGDSKKTTWAKVAQG